MKRTQKKLTVKLDTLRALSTAELRPVGGAVGASIDTWTNRAPSCAWTCNFSVCDCPPPPL